MTNGVLQDILETTHSVKSSLIPTKSKKREIPFTQTGSMLRRLEEEGMSSYHTIGQQQLSPPSPPQPSLDVRGALKFQGFSSSTCHPPPARSALAPAGHVHSYPSCVSQKAPRWLVVPLSDRESLIEGRGVFLHPPHLRSFAWSWIHRKGPRTISSHSRWAPPHEG